MHSYLCTVAKKSNFFAPSPPMLLLLEGLPFQSLMNGLHAA